MKCSAITAKGIRCAATSTFTEKDKNYCKIHHHSLVLHGPHKQARLELGYVHKRDMNEYEKMLGETQSKLTTIAEVSTRCVADRAWIKARKLKHALEMHELIAKQKDEINRTGIDPDEDQKEAALIRQIHRMETRERRREARQQREALNRGFLQEIELDGPEGHEGHEGHDELMNLARDPQNVHTTRLSEQTNKIIAFVRKIPVPETYQWNTEYTSLTPYELGMQCRLSPAASAQMMSQYAVSIDGLEAGIYGKVLDCVWQYVVNSPSKQDLCKRIGEELEDNIGMCAQGNLVRICNILSGYIPDIPSVMSRREELGNKLYSINETSDWHSIKIKKAREILEEYEIPVSEQAVWLELIE